MMLLMLKLLEIVETEIALLFDAKLEAVRLAAMVDHGENMALVTSSQN